MSEQEITDAAETDAHIRAVARRFLPAVQVYGNSHGVPTLCDVVDALGGGLERAYFIERCLELEAADRVNFVWFREGDRVQPFVNCSDLFAWACADCEPVTPENFSELERAVADAGGIYADSLFACRMRKMRPQGCAYPREEEEKLWPLFDACGPKRTDERSKRPAETLARKLSQQFIDNGQMG